LPLSHPLSHPNYGHLNVMLQILELEDLNTLVRPPTVMEVIVIAEMPVRSSVAHSYHMK